MDTEHNQVTDPTAAKRARIEATLDSAEKAFGSNDPYARAHGYQVAGTMYTELATTVKDPLLKVACLQAGERYMALAARVRFLNHIPTLLPKTEAEMLGLLGRCETCSRPWSVDSAGACADCPQLLWGPIPRTEEEARLMPRPRAVNSANWAPDSQEPD